MANGTGSTSNSLQNLYRAAVLILFTIACFLGSQIYLKVDAFPKEYTPLSRYEATQKKVEEFPSNYVSLERYKCDVEKIEKGIDGLHKKFDRYISKHEE